MTDQRPDDPPPAAPGAVSIRLARPDEYAAAGDLVADVYGAAGYAAGPYLGVLRDAARRAAIADLLVAVDAAGRVLGTLTYAPGGTPSPTSPPRTRRSSGCSPSTPPPAAGASAPPSSAPRSSGRGPKANAAS